MATQQSVGARPETQRMGKARWGQGRPIAAALDQCARDTKVFDMVKEIEGQHFKGEQAELRGIQHPGDYKRSLEDLNPCSMQKTR